MKEKADNNKTLSVVEDVELADVSGGFGSLTGERRKVSCTVTCVNCGKSFDSANDYIGPIKMLTNHHCPHCGCNSLESAAGKLPK